ncbi:hypothetical protein [Sphingopyxis sp.]|uniref:hypothetical protein n=1 Tax=Sphingopyxis sp. TaxID=1908224 RepID=UPI002D78001A|nr:hypothetical protein [Sphingopyxis sp.]HET6524064.1 hypothetical protein [Sphingopyxis sp.]
MRATATLSPVRKGKQHLLASCAIAAGIAALSYGGPAVAQVAGTGSFASGTGSIGNDGATNSTTVNVDGAQSIINWVPTDTAPTGGAIDLLPAGENWNFVGTGDYTVLNRFVNGSGGSLSRQIALNGTVNAYTGSTSGPRGGNIWFYNAGGILIGASGVINVGSLLLTTNDIVTTGGLFGADGSIRFNGASGSTSAITVNGAINADIGGSPGSSYVALVAPRVVQAGAVRVDGSAAYVAAEQANIRINGGLFDIDVTVGAEGGNAITHTGTTTGPAHLDTNGNQSRIYMVAIPKNDAVTMLVSGAIGYDDALSAQVDPDGAVRLSAGYNITAGEQNPAPVNAAAANIVVNDTLFRSNTVARASGTFVGEALQQIPGSPPPLSSAGRIFVEGDGVFSGDAGATLTIGTGQQGGATGNLVVRSDGAPGAAGNVAVNVTGGTFSTGNLLQITSLSQPATVTGNSQGGTASLTVTGGTLTSPTIVVSASAAADDGTNGDTGDARGGNASISVRNAGTTLNADAVTIDASASGSTNIALPTGSDAQGGTATLTVADGASFSATTSVSIDANGSGGFGPVQAGNGTGGTARIDILGANSSFESVATSLEALGSGGSFSGPNDTLNGGDGTGGNATLVINSDNGGIKSLGTLSLDASGRGGDAGGENSVGGDALGGTASLTADGGATAQFSEIELVASAAAGAATSPSGTTGLSGNARGNDVTLTATNGSTIDSDGPINLFAVGRGEAGENFGTGNGGNIAVSATAGGAITTTSTLTALAMGGSMSGAPRQSAGNGVGGDIDFTADSGTIQTPVFDVDASSDTANVTGTGGTAQGGTIDLFARNGGQIVATADEFSRFTVSARSGVSAAGTAATGGSVQLAGDAGTIDLGIGANLSADGRTGGAAVSGANNPTGIGGAILIRVEADALDSSRIDAGELFATADGQAQAEIELPPGVEAPVGNSQGGTMSVIVAGGTLTGNVIDLSANGGTGDGSTGNGTGGTATFTQTGGTVSVSDISIAADGFGGTAQGVSGTGIGGIAAIDLSGGTITAADITASANGEGGIGFTGDDSDPLNIVTSGDGGIGRGGTATISISGAAIVDASVIQANALGTGGEGGQFDSFFSGIPGDAGNAGDGFGGEATVNVRGGTTTASSLVADASGTGGTGGSSFFSSSGGPATGIGVGGTGGTGRGGTATIALETAIDGVGAASSVALGTGGAGGIHNVGGDGGDGTGGAAQAIVTGFEAGELAVTIDSTGTGGNGADGNDGAGGSGGGGTGGTSRIAADGAGASLTAVQSNLVSGGIGGNGGAGALGFSSFPTVAPDGGDGGDGQGGTIEIAANDGGTVALGLDGGDIVSLSSGGSGGAGGLGSDSSFGEGNQSGSGGNGGAGTGGTVRLVATGGAITSNGEAVDIAASGLAGEGGSGGVGQGGGTDGGLGTSGQTTGGRVVIETAGGASGAGQIDLGPTSIAANGDFAGRIELRARGDISFAGLAAEALGIAAPTNNDTDSALAGIFVAPTGGTIASQGDVTLTTDGSIGVHAQSAGTLDVDGTLTIDAGDQIDIRHDAREGDGPTLRATGNLTATAATSISGAPGSLIAADGALSLTTGGTIGVDGLAGDDITLTSSGATTVEHAEAVNDFTANAASFATGLNSIITGGDIDISSPGAVDLGNSSAGGFVQVSGQSIVFNSIDAGLSVSLSADGTAPGAEGISGGSIAAGGNINLFANSIALTGAVTGDASLFASGGAVSVNSADVAGTISIFSADDLSGSFIAGGDIFLNSGGDIDASAQANGGYVDGNGIAAEGNLFVVAAGGAALTDSSAARMFGVSAGGAASIDGGAAGEDMLVIAGTTASLTDVSVGDDLTVRTPGNIDAVNVSATGDGADTHILEFSSGSGSPIFTIGVGDGSGADIVMTSANGAIDAATLSAGDDILLNAANGIAINGATTLGLGTTGGDSSIRTQGGATTLAGIDAFSDVIVDAAGLTNLSGSVAAGRNATINAQDVTLAALTDPGGNAVPTLSADGDVVINSATGIAGGGVRALGGAALTAGNAIGLTTVEGQNVTLTGTTGIDVEAANILGAASLNSSDGDIRIGSLLAAGAVDASADAIRIEGGGNLAFATLTTDVGDAYVRANGDLSVANGNVAGTADFGTQGEGMSIGTLNAANAILANSGGFLNLDTVTVAGSLDASALASLGITGVVTGQSIGLASGNITIGSAGRVGTAGVTQQLSVANNNSDNQTFVGGAPGTSVAGYHIDADELTRLYASQIEIVAPAVQAAGSSSVGSTAPPDVIVDTFTMTGGAAGSNLGANGALTIRTPGKMRVIGNVELTGLTDANTLNLVAGDALEVILGQGSVRLVNGADPAGQLNLVSDDVIVATAEAIADVGAATSTSAINTRLAQNDGIVLDEGALFARGIRAEVVGGFYVQNSGAGTDLAQRRGLTFGAGGLDVVTDGPSRIVVNGVALGANGQVTGLDALQLLTIGGAAPVPGSYDRGSTVNGCLISSPTVCATVVFDIDSNFPVQDVIEEIDGDEESEGEGNTLPQPLITMREVDPLTGAPLLDDPVTGAGNDDLWTPPAE